MTDHIHWPGPVGATVNAFGQDLTITVDEVPGDPIGTLRIKEASFVGAGLILPNSTNTSPVTDPIPGTNPTLVVRQDGSWPSDYIQVEPATGPVDPFSQDAAWITTGILPYQRLAGTIPENETIVLYNRPTLSNPGTALDSWRWLYNGTRTVYGNEFNLLRVRGVPEDQVPARFMSNAARDGLTTAVFQVSLSNASTHLFQVLGNGSILGPAGASMLPSAPLGVAFTGTIANATLINDGVVGNTGAPYPVTSTYTASDNRVWLDGNFTNTGASVPAQTTLFTIDAAHRPAAWVQFFGRTSGNLAVRFTCKGATGVCVADQAIGTGITYSVDGANFRKA
jgi:hypothetical protein